MADRGWGRVRPKVRCNPLKTASSTAPVPAGIDWIRVFYRLVERRIECEG